MAMRAILCNITGYKVRMMNPLTKRARHNARRETVENYLIAGFAGAILGAMLALAI